MHKEKVVIAQAFQVISVKMPARVRGFVFTLNNWSIEEREKILNYLEKSKKIEKWIFGQEVGSVRGTPHLQGYIYYKNGRSKDAVEKEINLINRIWLKQAKGGPKSNYIYCTKENEYLLGGDWAKIIEEVEREREEEETMYERRREYIRVLNDRYDKAKGMRDLVYYWVNPEWKDMGWDSGYEDDVEDNMFLDVKQFMDC